MVKYQMDQKQVIIIEQIIYLTGSIILVIISFLVDLQQSRQQCYFSGNPVVSCVISPEASTIHERRDESNGKNNFFLVIMKRLD